MQLVDDDELSIITSISLDDDDELGLSSLASFVTMISLNISDVDEPTSELASTPLSPEVEPTSMLSCRSFDEDEAMLEGDGESFSSSEIDERGDEVDEVLKIFAMNIFGVERPPVSQPL